MKGTGHKALSSASRRVRDVLTGDWRWATYVDCACGSGYFHEHRAFHHRDVARKQEDQHGVDDAA